MIANKINQIKEIELEFDWGPDIYLQIARAFIVVSAS